jgi:hypothetical protein
LGIRVSLFALTLGWTFNLHKEFFMKGDAIEDRFSYGEYIGKRQSLKDGEEYHVHAKP